MSAPIKLISHSRRHTTNMPLTLNTSNNTQNARPLLNPPHPHNNTRQSISINTRRPIAIRRTRHLHHITHRHNNLGNTSNHRRTYPRHVINIIQQNRNRHKLTNNSRPRSLLYFTNTGNFNRITRRSNRTMVTTRPRRKPTTHNTRPHNLDRITRRHTNISQTRLVKITRRRRTNIQHRHINRPNRRNRQRRKRFISSRRIIKRQIIAIIPGHKSHIQTYPR